MLTVSRDCSHSIQHMAREQATDSHTTYLKWRRILQAPVQLLCAAGRIACCLLLPTHPAPAGAAAVYELLLQLLHPITGSLLSCCCRVQLAHQLCTFELQGKQPRRQAGVVHF